MTVALLDITEECRIDRELIRENRRLTDLAHRDRLTGLYNRTHFEETIECELKRLNRGGGKLSLALLDVDHFKIFNDSYGHLAGDDCLTAISTAASAVLRRPSDVLCRYGGEELVAILPETDENGALVIAERLRRAVEAQNLPHAHNPFGRITISVGVATLGGIGPADALERRDQIVGAADNALYLAKSRGRNQVASFSEFCAELAAPSSLSSMLVTA